MNETHRIPVPPANTDLPAGSAPAPPQSGAPHLRDVPIPNPRTVIQSGIFILMVFYTLYFTREIFVPITLAVFLYLMFQPLMRLMGRWHVPRAIGALLIIAT